MSRRHSLEHHRKSLAEIREIMNSMKMLAYMETRKLDRFLQSQQVVVKSIERIASDFLGFYGEYLKAPADSTPVYILIGTERGFCGGINNALIRELDEIAPDPPSKLIAMGHKLHSLLEDDPREAVLLEGASVAEDIESRLHQLVETLSAMLPPSAPHGVVCLYYNNDDTITRKVLLPPFESLLNQPPEFNHAPLMNIPAEDFMLELTDHYLFSALHEILYSALMAENHQRISHLEGAVRHLDEESAQLVRKGNMLRQEEIIEEIEVILLSATSLENDSPLCRQYQGRKKN